MTDKFAIYPSLEGASVLITGGATGIGAAHVRQFAKQRSKVAFVDIQETAGRALVSEIESEYGGTAYFADLDLTDVAVYRDFVAEVERRHGAPTVLVNNAANDARQSFDAVSPEDWNASFALNLRPHFFMAQALVPGMTANNGGSIINTGSISWRVKGADVAAYQAAKAGIEGLTRALARDLGKHRIRVNCIAPGMVRTDRQAEQWKGTDKFESYLERQCLKTIVMPDDIAQMALWLASDDSKLVTAQTFIVDAGAV